jgi:4-amino-4-deoxy-L-arabinose transferase-like glycosyltransferase
MAAIAVLAFALRVNRLDFQSLWRDEVDAVRFAFQPLASLIHTFVEPGQNGPLYYLLLRPWLDLAGQSEFALRYFSLFFGLLAVPLIYQLGMRMFPRQRFLGLVAAMLVATSPYLIWYSQEGKMYALTVVLVLLSVERYWAALSRGGWQRWLGYLLATSAAFYIHLIAALIVPAQVAMFFLFDRNRQSQSWKPWLVSTGILVLPYVPLLAWQLPLLLVPAQTGYAFLSLPNMLYSMYTNYSHGVVLEPTWWVLSLYIGLPLAAMLWGKARGLGATAIGSLLCWLLLPAVAFFLITLARPMYTARYLIFLLPALLLLLAAGLYVVWFRSRLLAALALIVLLTSNGWALSLQANTPLKADFRGATAYLREHRKNGDLIIFQIPYGRYSYDYYTTQQASTQPSIGRHRMFLPITMGGGGKVPRWAEGLYTNAGMGSEDLDRQMTELTMGTHVVWLVSTEESLWDERGLVKGWLDGHATLTDEAEFVRVTLYRYELDLMP